MILKTVVVLRKKESPHLHVVDAGWMFVSTLSGES
jgi:hypothetical protein